MTSTKALRSVHSMLIECLRCAGHYKQLCCCPPEPYSNTYNCNGSLMLFSLLTQAVSFPGGSQLETIKSKSLQMWHIRGRPRAVSTAYLACPLPPLFCSNNTPLVSALLDFALSDWPPWISFPDFLARPTPIHPFALRLSVTSSKSLTWPTAPLYMPVVSLTTLNHKYIHVPVCPKNILEGRDCLLPHQCWAPPGT